ncbi:response regulator [Parapedobacter sp. ISTM3]|uniref:Response regulator receiver domain-containing protein n=1 Tax=Parapedobacter luteus TaxID=623280 RepID=A0A1T5DD11_9SPHI|nr:MULTISPECIES: response regulator [Parapedobacter]MBK1438427.1 response regulator [Parapedobacter sp. ISTM3]SKB69511.1 Response regulator receiver domain-containing protein [Parapedobacter luteus]
MKRQGTLSMAKKILYAEDDGDMLDIVSEFMQFEDYEVVTDNGKTIKKKLKQHQIGLILLDENLNWGWGSDLCRELRADKETAGIPIVLISALRDIDKIAEQCGATTYIRKPFDIYDVIDVVNLHYLPQ